MESRPTATPDEYGCPSSNMMNAMPKTQHAFCQQTFKLPTIFIISENGLAVIAS